MVGLFGGMVETAVPGVRYDSALLDRSEARTLMARVVTELPWEQKPVVVAGISMQQPRLVCMLGRAGVSYTYAGLTLETVQMPSYLEALMRRVEEASDARFNCCLANYYRDGRDSIGMHRDAEPELGRDPVIGSISLGATRQFVMKEIGGAARHKIALEDGSLLVMGRGVQRQWLHGIDKQPGAGARVNFTFRLIQRG